MTTGRRGLDALHQLREEFDRQFPQFWDTLSNVAPRVSGRAYPALNIWEHGDDFFAEAEVPGLRNEDLDISVVGNELTIKGNRGESTPEGAAYHRRERGTGSFIRVVRLPVEIDASRVQATLNHGVLLLTLPKSDVAKARKIQVNVV